MDILKQCTTYMIQAAYKYTLIFMSNGKRHWNLRIWCILFNIAFLLISRNGKLVSFGITQPFIHGLMSFFPLDIKIKWILSQTFEVLHLFHVACCLSKLKVISDLFDLTSAVPSAMYQNTCIKCYFNMDWCIGGNWFIMAIHFQPLGSTFWRSMLQ